MHAVAAASCLLDTILEGAEPDASHRNSGVTGELLQASFVILSFSAAVMPCGCDCRCHGMHVVHPTLCAPSATASTSCTIALHAIPYHISHAVHPSVSRQHVA